MGKKAKGGNPLHIFQNIKDKLQSKHFAEAASILRRAKFPPPHKKKADQFNIDIHYFWALDYFEKKDYLQAVTTLRMFVERFKKKINLPIEKANMLLGLSYFYANDFTKAAAYLVTAKNKPTTHTFYFYYLLTLIYQKKYTDLTALTTDHEKELALLTTDQKSYLAIAIALVQSNFEKAIMLLSTYSIEDENIADNIDGLKAILQETAYAPTTKSLKPLYKSFLDITLSEEEKQYLAKIPEFQEQVKNLKNNQLQETLVVPLQELCEKGIALTRQELKQAMELPEAYRSYIVYNQVAALYNDDLEENELEIVAILKKYEWNFFQVPEAIFLFAQIVYWDSENFTPTFFWRNLERSLERFGKSFTPLQLNRLSWRISGCLDDPAASDKNMNNNRQRKLVTAYPQMLGLKWWQIDRGVFAPDCPFSDTTLSIFTNANFRYGSHIAKDKWEDGLEGMYPDLGLIANFLGPFEMSRLAEDGLIDKQLNDIYTKVLYQAQNFLVRATTEHQVHLKNKVVLDLFKMTHESMNKFEKDRERTLDKTKKATFFEAYYKMIVLFEEDQADSKYLQDYQLVENAPKINRLAKVVGTYERGKTLIDLFKQHLAAGESSLIHQVLVDDLEQAYAMDEGLNTTLVYFNVLIEVAETELTTIVRQFGNLYVKRIRLIYVPRYPDTSFFYLLEKLTKNKPTPAYITIINALTAVYLPFITKTVEPLYYNMAEKLLSYFIKAKKKQPNFEFNQVVIQALKKLVKEAVEARKLKKLGKTLTSAEKIFPLNA